MKMMSALLSEVKWINASVLMSSLISCGTYSTIRSADTLNKGQIEGNLGLGVNQFGEGVPLARASVGLTNRLEASAHFETYSALASLRYGLLKSKSSPIALSLGVEGGTHVFLRGGLNDNLENELIGVAFSIGKAWKWGDLYLSHKSFISGIGNSRNFYFSTNRLGSRLNVSDFFLIGFETGASIHHDIGVVETTGFIGFRN